MKKAFDQTVRDLKREVNKKVLKVPSIEQKVLDATSNEPWGPHGSLLADIAQATRNYHDYQMIMSVMWKRINDTGKNWRHVYKALTVLEYLVAHGSERVIDEIREHAYQISTLSDFQYIDSSGRDQGNNVRKKSQSLVVLVNDKERIQEVRQKAASNKDKYHNTSMGNMYRPGSFSSSGGYGDRYDDDRYEARYGNREDDRNGYGRERDLSSRDDGRYGRYGDSYGREGDKNSRDYEERYGRDGYKDDDYRGRGQNNDDYHYGSRSRSSDRDRDSGYDDDGQYMSRGSGAKADDHSQEGSTTGKRLDRKYSEQNLDAPPSYEDAVNNTRSPSYSERDTESSIAFAPKTSSPPTGAGPSPTTTAAAPAQAAHSPPAPASAPDSNQEVGSFDEFDPRGSFSAAPTTSSGAAPATSGDVEMDPLGFLSESFSSNSLALVPAIQPIMSPEANASANFSSGPTFVAASSEFPIANQPFGDPFGDGPFKAVPSSDSVPAQQQVMTSTNSFDSNYSGSLDMPQPVPQKVAIESGNTSYNATYIPSGPVQPSPANTQFVHQELSSPNQDVDILADILPPSASLSFVNTQANHQVPASQSVSHTNQLASQSNAPQNSFQTQTGQTTGFPTQLGMPSSQATYPLQSAESFSQTGFQAQSMALTFPVQAGHASQMGFHSQTGQPTSLSGFPSQVSYSQANVQTSLGGQSAQPNLPNSNFYGAYNGMISPNSNGTFTQHNSLSQSGSAVSMASQMGPQAPQVRPSSSMALVSTIPTSTGPSATVPQPSKDKFETKSSVWADTLSRGLVNLNISGSKTNPLADIGVDFDAINRKEKRMEKPTTATVTSTVTMGKAMGSGSGMGRAGSSALRPPPNPMMSSGGPMAGMGRGMGMGTGTGMGMGTGMGVGMGMGMGVGMGMGGYGVSQPMGRAMNIPGTVGMNMGTAQGIQMQQQTIFTPGSTMPAGYNPMMGTSNYGQQPYGGGYR